MLQGDHRLCFPNHSVAFPLRPLFFHHYISSQAVHQGCVDFGLVDYSATFFNAYVDSRSANAYPCSHMIIGETYLGNFSMAVIVVTIGLWHF